MRSFRLILIGTALALVVTAVCYTALIRPSPGAQHEHVDQPSSSEEIIYANQRLGVSFRVPSKYRLASDYMEFLNAHSGHPIANWSATNSQDIVIMEASLLQERTFLSQLHGSPDFNNVSAFPKSIYITATDFDLKNLEQSIADLPSADRMAYQMLRVSGLSAIRYTSPSHETVVIISLNHPRTLPEGTVIQTIFGKVSETAETSVKGAFDDVLRTLRYVE